MPATIQITAKYDTKNGCMRCGRPIERGMRLERWNVPNGRQKWCHVGCTPAAGWGARIDADDAASARPTDAGMVRSIVEDVIGDMDLGQYQTEEFNASRIEARVRDGLEKKLTGVLENRLAATGKTLHELLDGTLKEREHDLATRLGNVANQLESKVAELDKARRVVVEVRQPDSEPRELNGCVHPAFEEVMFHLQAGDNVMLVGPTGCGKTFLGSQLAEAMGLPFGFISCSSGLTESSILGMREPNDQGGMTYQVSAFVKAYEEGHLFLWDECDALDPNVFLAVNAALSGDKLSVPKRFAKPIAFKHEKAVCLAAANTYGNGADRQYVGRNQLDGASVDRYTFITMDYDEAIERQVCPDDDLLRKLHGIRAKIRVNRLHRNLSTRFIAKAYTWVSMGKDYEYVEQKLFEGWNDNDIRKVR